MDEQTVNEELEFTESDFEADQTAEESEATVQETTEQPTSEETSEESTAGQEAPQTVDEIDDFLAKKGIKSDDPDALRKVADMYRNVEKEFNKKSQEKAKLERQLASNPVPGIQADNTAGLDAGQQALVKLQGMEIERATKEWKESKHLTPEVEKKMMEYLDQDITTATGQQIKRLNLLVAGALSLDEVYTLVGGEAEESSQRMKEYKEAVKKEIVARQTANRPSAKATNSTQFSEPSKDYDSQILEELGLSDD